MATPFAHPSFAAGEIDPDTHGRVDVDRFHVGLARAENFRVKKTGTLERRGGQRFLGRVKYGDRRTAFWKLKRDAANNYSIEVGHHYFRFWKDRRPIMQGTATAAADMLHLLGGHHVWVASATPSLWYLTDDVGGPPAIYGQPATVKRYQAGVDDVTLPEQTIASIADGWAWGDRDGLGFSTLYVADPTTDLNDEVATGYRIAIPWHLEVESPYDEADVPLLKKDISGDVIFITRSGYPPAKLERFGDFDWRYSEIDFNGQTDPVDDYSFVSGFALPTPPASPQYAIQYQISRLGVDGNESEPRQIYVLANNVPDVATPPPIGTLGPVWTIESTEQGDERNVIVDPNDYEWIDAYTYSGGDEWRYETPSGPSGEIRIWFLARKGTGLDGPGAGGTNLAQDPGIFDGKDQSGPVRCFDITNLGSPAGMTRYKKTGAGIPSGSNGWADLGEWGYGISAEIRNDSLSSDRGIINFKTLWVLAGDWIGTVGSPTGRVFELTVEVDAGYNLYRRYAKIVNVDGDVQGGQWFPWGRLAAIDAYGGTLLDNPARSPYVDPATQLTRIVGTYKDGGGISPDETLEPPSVLLDFDQPGKYPEAVGFLGQRLVLAGSDDDPNRIRLSATGEFYNFNTPQTLKDADPIDRDLTTPERILYVVEVGNGSGIAFTAGSEWRLWGEGGVISPLTINTVRISTYGCLEVAPINVGSRLLYLTELGRALHGIAFDLAQDNFASRDFSTMSGHMLRESGIVAMDFAQTPDKTVYMVREDGTAIGITFDEDQQMNAWHRHSTPNGAYQWVHSTRFGRADDVYFVVRRTIDGETVQYLEALDLIEWTRQEQACFLDASVSLEQPRHEASDLFVSGGYSFVTCADWESFEVGDELIVDGVEGDDKGVLTGFRFRVNATGAGLIVLGDLSTGAPITSWGDLELPFAGPFVLRKLVTRLWGLDHLEGETVAVLGDGRDLGDFVVSGGKVDLLFGVADAVVGLPFEAKIDSLPFTGAAGTDTILDAKRNVTALHVHFRNTDGIEIGLRESELVSFRPEDVENPNLPAPLMNGVKTVQPFGSWGDGRLYVRARRPFPAHILSITPEYEIGRG
jgi:hypothetical protein